MQANFEQKSQTLKEIVLKDDDGVGFYSTFFWACATRVVYPARACMFGKCFSVYSEQFTVKKLGNLRINLKYKNALTETNNLILYGEFDGVLTIDADRNVFTDYL